MFTSTPARASLSGETEQMQIFHAGHKGSLNQLMSMYENDVNQLNISGRFIFNVLARTPSNINGGVCFIK